MCALCAAGDSDAEHAVLLGSSGAAAFIDADAAAAALGGGSGAGGAGARLGELSGSDDDHDNLHGGSHGGDFVEALLQEDADMADMQADMDGHAQGVRKGTPLIADHALVSSPLLLLLLCRLCWCCCCLLRRPNLLCSFSLVPRWTPHTLHWCGDHCRWSP